VAVISRAALLPKLGRWAQRVGPQKLFRASGLGLSLIPLLWLIPGTGLGWFVTLQVATGACMAAYEMAVTLVYLNAIPAAERTSVLTRYSIFNTLAMLLGSSLGATLLWFVPSYALLFALAAVARLASLSLLRTPASSQPPTARRDLARQFQGRLRVAYRNRTRSLRPPAPKKPFSLPSRTRRT